MKKFGKDVAAVSNIFSHEVTQLYESTVVQTAYEAFTVLFHGFMLESGFIPKDVPEETRFHCMPENWNGKAVHKILYSHSCCTSFTCCMTCVPLYQNMSVQGTVSDADCLQSVYITVLMNSYLKERKFSDAMGDFRDLNELSRFFKDGFCLPLLNLLCETAGYSRLFGLPGMVDDVKVYMLQYLPVKDVVSMSAVNKKFNFLANLPELWKYIFLRDFAKGGVPDVDSASSSTVNWKQKYRQEYLKRKRPSIERMYPYFLDPIEDLYTELPGIWNPFGFDPSPFTSPPILPPRLFPPFRRLI